MSSDSPIIKKLKRVLESHQISTAPETLLVYSSDVTKNRSLPSVVVFPQSTPDVVKIVNTAVELSIPITARGAGTGMSGGAVPITGGIAISFERMNSIIELNVEKRYAIAEPGVITFKLQSEAAKVGLFYPPDPSSNKISTLGGNIAENAGGLRCVKYGVTSDYIAGLEYVSADGSIEYTGVMNDNNDGIDLTQLFCGSEGTLGIITRAMFRLIPAPYPRRAISAEFASITDAASTVQTILRKGILPSILEYIDKSTLDVVTKYISLNVSENTGAVLLIEFDDAPEKRAENIKKTTEICESLGAIKINIAKDEEEAEKLWKLRKTISPALSRMTNGKINEDVCVPRGKLVELVNMAGRLSGELNLPVPVYGHAGDGNLHVNFMYDTNNPDETERVQRGVEAALKEVVSMGGTISGEHGIGLSKLKYLPLQFSAEKIEFHRQLKKALDPRNLLNPGKIFTTHS